MRASHRSRGDQQLYDPTVRISLGEVWETVSTARVSFAFRSRSCWLCWSPVTIGICVLLLSVWLTYGLISTVENEYYSLRAVFTDLFREELV